VGQLKNVVKRLTTPIEELDREELDGFCRARAHADRRDGNAARGVGGESVCIVLARAGVG
jgi:hypothetical protein